MPPGMDRGRFCCGVLPPGCPVPSLDSLASTHFLRRLLGPHPRPAIPRAQTRKGPQASTVPTLGATSEAATSLWPHCPQRKSPPQGQPGRPRSALPFGPVPGEDEPGREDKARLSSPPPPHRPPPPGGNSALSVRTRVRARADKGGCWAGRADKSQMAGLLLSASVPSRRKLSCNCV